MIKELPAFLRPCRVQLFHFGTIAALEPECQAGRIALTVVFRIQHPLAVGTVLDAVQVQHGAANIRRMFPGATTVFLLPPSVEELEHRLRGRGTETEESIQERLATARQELAEQDKFTVKLVNNQIEPCAAELYQVICQRAGLQG